MKNNFRKRSSSYLYDYNKDDNKDENNDEKYCEDLSKGISKKKKFTDLICSLINWVSLIVTTIYNVYWINLFHQILPNVEDDQLKNCQEVFNWNNYCYTWVIISISKAFILLLCSQLSTGSEFDCNFFCLSIKILSSFIPSIVFVMKIPYYGSNIFDSINDGACFSLYENLAKFYRYESNYLIFIVCLCTIPILGGIGMAIKEYVKCLAEKNEYENNYNN